MDFGLEQGTPVELLVLAPNQALIGPVNNAGGADMGIGLPSDPTAAALLAAVQGVYDGMLDPGFAAELRAFWSE